MRTASPMSWRAPPYAYDVVPCATPARETVTQCDQCTYAPRRSGMFLRSLAVTFLRRRSMTCSRCLDFIFWKRSMRAIFFCSAVDKLASGQYIQRKSAEAHTLLQEKWLFALLDQFLLLLLVFAYDVLLLLLRLSRLLLRLHRQ
jgi:hypothetical protein